MRIRFRILGLFLALCLLLAPAAFATEGPHIAPDTVLTPAQLPVSGYLSFDLQLTGYEVLPNYEGLDCIVLDWVFTNLSKTPVSFNDAVFVNLYQPPLDAELEDYRLTPTVLMEYDEVNEDTAVERLSPITVKTMHLILNREDNIRLIIRDMQRDPSADVALDVTLSLGGDAPVPLKDPELIVINLLRHGFIYYHEFGESGWYGSATDAERVQMAQTLLTLFESLGYDISGYTPNSFAQSLNNRFDNDKSLTIWETACQEMGVAPEPYSELFKE